MKKLLAALLTVVIAFAVGCVKTEDPLPPLPTEKKPEIGVVVSRLGRQYEYSVLKVTTAAELKQVTLSGQSGEQRLKGCDEKDGGNSIWYFHVYHKTAEPETYTIEVLGQTAEITVTPEKKKTPASDAAELAGLMFGEFTKTETKVAGKTAIEYLFPKEPVWNTENDLGLPYAIFPSFVEYIAENGRTIVAPRLNFSVREDASPYNVPGVNADTRFYLTINSFSPDGLGTFVLYLSNAASELSQDGKVRTYYADSGYPMLCLFNSIGRDINQERATLRALCVEGTNVLFDREAEFDPGMSKWLGEAASGFFAAGGSEQEGLYLAENSVDRALREIYCAYPPTVLLDGDRQLNVYTSGDVTELVCDSGGVEFSAVWLGNNTKKWTAVLEEDSADRNISIMAKDEYGMTSIGTLKIKVQTQMPDMKDCKTGGTELFAGGHLELFPEGAGALEYFEAVSADGTPLGRSEGDRISIPLEKEGLCRIYVRGFADGRYTAHSICVEALVKPAGG